jgi:hypothetical protein
MGTGADLKLAFIRKGFVAVLPSFAIPEFVGFLLPRAIGLRVAYRPCSPKKPPRRSRDPRVHPRTGFTTKGQEMSFMTRTGKTGYVPLSRERRRLGSFFACRRLLGLCLPAQNVPRLQLGMSGRAVASFLFCSRTEKRPHPLANAAHTGFRQRLVSFSGSFRESRLHSPHPIPARALHSPKTPRLWLGRAGEEKRAFLHVFGNPIPLA